MTQVPHYLIIGNGRVAKHFQYYFSHLPLSYSTWQRNEPLVELDHQLMKASHILLLIKDDAIDPFIQQFLQSKKIVQQNQPLLIHCSGSLVSAHAVGAHPLMTFSHHLYDLALYQSVPFVIDHDAPSFKELFPGLPNPHVYLQKAFKAKYHALCVMAGNFSCLLWKKLMDEIENEFKLPANIVHPYLLQQSQNLITHLPSALTGPLTRNDKKTIAKNLEALQQDPFQRIYQAFIDCYQSIASKTQ